MTKTKSDAVKDKIHIDWSQENHGKLRKASITTLGLTSGGVHLHHFFDEDAQTLFATAGKGGPTVFTVDFDTDHDPVNHYLFTQYLGLDHHFDDELDDHHPVNFTFYAEDHNGMRLQGMSAIHKNDLPLHDPE